MSWYRMREMTKQDLRAIYRFIKSLGPVGEQCPTLFTQIKIRRSRIAYSQRLSR